MRKIKLSYILAGGLLTFSAMSCSDLDRYPFNQIEQSQSFLTIRDARSHNNGLYAFVRGRSAGLFTYSTDIQSDMLNAGLDYGNRNGSPHRWDDFLSSDYTIRDTWQPYYSNIANFNNQIAGFESMELTVPAEVAELNRFRGDAYFARAFWHFNLVQRFAKAYNPSTASSDLGIPVILSYDITLMPERSTMAQTFTQILDDINTAKGLLAGEAGKQGATRFNSDVVLALEARVKLYMQDYAGAKAAAEILIGSGRYPLITDAEDLEEFWHLDGTQEVIFQPHVAAPSELPPVNGNVYLGYSSSTEKYIPDFIPSQWVLDMYEDDDYRKDIYFANLPVYIQGTDYPNLYLVNKYPGNPALFTGANTNYAHAPKMFRIAEAYLISAEAGYVTDAPASVGRLNDLRVARGLDALPASLSGAALLQEIKDERFRELAFEGFRLDDLKRWGEPMTRRDPQDLNPIQTGPNFHTLSKLAGDDKFVWGIPLRDQTVNPNIDQNPGW